MPEPARVVAERLYAALQSVDAETLIEIVDPEFSGRVSAGMPLEAGGDIEGAKAMIVGVWGRVAGDYDTAPYPDEYVEVSDERIITLGFYRGRHRGTGRDYEAAFAHDLVLRDGRLVSLTQITDTVPWHQAADE